MLVLTGDVTLTTALPQVTDEIFLEGNGFTIGRDPGAPGFRILDLQVAGDVALRDVTLTNGSVDGRGGGILNDASRLTLLGTRVVGNEATSDGGGIRSNSNARALFMESSTVAYNTSGYNGGGLHAHGVNVISGSTFSGNSDVGFFGGGAITTDRNTRITLVNSTISNNDSQRTGGININPSYSDLLTLVSSTLVGNSGAQAGGVQVYDGWLQPSGRIFDAVIADNVPLNCKGVFRPQFGGSFDDDGTCDGASLATPEIDFDRDLANNGGPTLTHAPLAGGVLVDAGGACDLATDQRGFGRDLPCDSGAVELGGAPVGGSLADLRGLTVTCDNVSSSARVTFPLGAGVNSWDCEAQGLVVGTGDTIKQTVVGGAIDGAGGSVIGLAASDVICRNEVTGQTVAIDLSTGPGWDCVADGLVVSTGDRIRMISTGVVP